MNEGLAADRSAAARAGARATGFGAVLVLAMGIGPLAVYALSALSPLVTSALNLNRTQLGLLATIAFIAAAISSGVVGRAADVLSARLVMAVLFLAAGVALLAIGLARSYVWLLIAVGVSGSAQALSNPITNRLISSHIPPGRRGALMGVKQSGVQMSQFVAGLALPSVALLLGWRGAIATAAAFALPGLALLHHSIPAHKSATQFAGSRRARDLPKAVWWLGGYAFLTGAAVQATNVYLPLFGYERLHLPVATAGLAAAMVGGVGLAARIVWGQLADRCRLPHRPLAFLAGASAVSALVLLAAGIAGWAWLMWLAAALFGASGIATNVVAMLAIVRVADPSVVGTASGVLAVGLYLGFAVGPVCFGSVVDALGYSTGWAGVAAVSVAAATVALLWRTRDGGRPAHPAH